MPVSSQAVATVVRWSSAHTATTVTAATAAAVPSQVSPRPSPQARARACAPTVRTSSMAATGHRWTPRSARSAK